MKIKIKKLNDLAKIPTKAHATDAGFDLYATSKSIDDYDNIVYGCGLAFEIPEGFVGLVFPRSSIANAGLILTNSVGVIDSGYRGEVMAKFKHVECGYPYAIGERFAQMIVMPIPSVEFEFAEELSASDRGLGGYGSTGK